ncbi:type I-E CRISPR-associated protein Cas5/CasD [Lentilactobacillus sp. IMAU92037]|uniref:type I-E CRISPR-associated protein Cas5/CasD n=1 Tax=Lentilactobacillus dabitei TaxID=2831523 RepID=UPI001C2BE8FF|nr:type I-E CRISPR-associated protein Cas5/CasD [Lentilactobacillus dabitei]MBV0929275.1 type I-E CRISPR-associated protein Cas5/CasD [Lentilactobacillus dabitei]
MKTLTIKLTSPLQSYGNEATFSRRTSDGYPSKSAIIGMISAALGYQRDDPRIAALNDLAFAVRVDQPGKALSDFQTVEWKRGTRKITYRDYFQDAVFMAALGSEDEQLIEQIETALKHPKFQLFLGRRSNVPAGVLQTATFSDREPVAVLKKMSWQASHWYQWRKRRNELVKDVAIISDANLLPDKRSKMIKDRVESFDQRNRRHGYRAVATDYVDLQNPCFENKQAEIDNSVETKHDIFGFL